MIDAVRSCGWNIFYVIMVNICLVRIYAIFQPCYCNIHHPIDVSVHQHMSHVHSFLYVGTLYLIKLQIFVKKMIYC